MREQILLNGTWRFQFDPHDLGLGERFEWMVEDYDRSDWPTTSVPDISNEYAASENPLRGYEGVLWYARHFTVPAAWHDRRVRVIFEGINYDATVWVNGRRLGDHSGAFIGFALDIASEILHYDRENVLVVKTDNRALDTRAPGPIYGWWNQGGLYREAYLEAGPRLQISDLTARTTVGRANVELSLAVEVASTEADSQVATLGWDLADDTGHIVASGATTSVHLAAGETVTQTFGARIESPRLWSPEAPYLYGLTVRLRVAEETVDRVRLPIGLREVRVEGTRILLNGREVLLKGVNRHEDYPSTGRNHDPEWLRHDLRFLKGLGINFIRTSHYPNHPELYRQADRLGFLVMDEVPLYWWGVDWPGLTGYRDERAVQAAESQVREMIRRDKNHPSVILWSVSNETGGGSALVDNANRHLIRVAKESDPTRPAVHVSMNWNVDTAFDTADIICINEYVGLHRNPKVGTVGDLPSIKGSLESALADLQQRYPDKPIVVTEFGCTGREGVRGDSFPSEDFQAAYTLTHLEILTHQPNIKGLVYWAYADYPYHRRYTRDFFPVGYYGLVTRERRPKAVAKVLQDAFANWQRSR